MAAEFTPPDEPISVVPFPTLNPAALVGSPGKIVSSVAPYTEAHSAAILLQYLSRFGCTVDRLAHLRVDNREHPARIWPLIVGKTSDGAKGTSWGVVSALYSAAEEQKPPTGLYVVRDQALLRQVSGMSSGEGLIEAIRDATGDDPNAKNFDEGVSDKRLLVLEEEFVSMLAVIERQGSILPRVLREAWDGNTLRTMTRSAQQASSPHITVIGHVTKGELRIRLKEAQLLGGTMNRFVPCASRRTKLLADGGNIPGEVLAEFGHAIAENLAAARKVDRVERTPDADRIWRDRYPELRRARPDGPVASMVARAAPQTLRLSLAYALADGSNVITDEHMVAAFALWQYAEDTAVWMFGEQVDSAEVEKLVNFISAAGTAGRTRTEITTTHFGGHKKAVEINSMLGNLLADGRIRQELEQPEKPGRAATRYYSC